MHLFVCDSTLYGCLLLISYFEVEWGFVIFVAVFTTFRPRRVFVFAILMASVFSFCLGFCLIAFWLRVVTVYPNRRVSVVMSLITCVGPSCV